MVEVEKLTVDIPIIIQNTGRAAGKALARHVGGTIMGNRPNSNHRVIRALDNVTFSIPPGGRLGLVGHNGAGKTTLLKTISGLYPISKGYINVQGSIRTFFNLSAGLEMSLSGRSNIKNIAFFYTQDPAEISELTPLVIEYSELGEFIDMPVSSYSAGMIARLIVSIALKFRGDILVMDEMLGAGDARFMKKVLKSVEEMMLEARTLIFASHATEIIRQFCDRAIWLEKGKVRMYGDVVSVTDEFHKTL